jgi:hypothetical protein
MSSLRIAGISVLGLALAWPLAPGRAAEEGAAAGTAPESGKAPAAQGAAAVSAAPPLYRLPKLGKPRGRIGGGRRGPLAGTANLQALVPDHVGGTTAGQPSLYWYLAEPVAEGVAIELTLIDERSIDPLVDAKLERPAAPGLQRIRLADYGVTLEPGQEYQWSVSVVPDPEDRSKDVVTTGWIERVPAPAGLAERLASAGPDGAVAIYGEAGLWYDMLDAAAGPVQERPDAEASRRQLAQLLEQAGLPAEAAGASR